jgi:hypothetical protein
VRGYFAFIGIAKLNAMTEAEREFERELRSQHKRRSKIVGDMDARIRELLSIALEKVLGILADQPTDYQMWSLTKLTQEIKVVSLELGDAATAQAAKAAQAAWVAGADLVTKPLAASGLAAGLNMEPHINARQLQAMRAFLTDRMQDVSAQAARLINSELGLVVLGAQNPYEAQKSIRSILEDKSAVRAGTIVRTELMRFYSTASSSAMASAAEAGVEMDKVWRRSSKTYPRLSHALTDGQRRPHDKPFILGMSQVATPEPTGGLRMMYPHDPTAPASETINCGCIAVPKPRRFAATVPDRKPFTQGELARNPKLRDMVEGVYLTNPIERI